MPKLQIDFCIISNSKKWLYFFQFIYLPKDDFFGISEILWSFISAFLELLIHNLSFMLELHVYLWILIFILSVHKLSLVEILSKSLDFEYYCIIMFKKEMKFLRRGKSFEKYCRWWFKQSWDCCIIHRKLLGYYF